MTDFRKADRRRGRIAYEVAGLKWLADAGPQAAPVVELTGSGSGPEGEWLTERRLHQVAPTPAAAEEFGRRLALTHAAGAEYLGVPPPGFSVGSGAAWDQPLYQLLINKSLDDNKALTSSDALSLHHTSLGLQSEPGPTREQLRSSDLGHAESAAFALASGSAATLTWGQYYANYAIRPYILDQVFNSDQMRILHRLCDRLEADDFEHPQPALVSVGQVARIHGDLWSGNVMWTPKGATLIDPQAHGDHGEEDLGTLALFSCPFWDRIVAAYNEVSPLADGWSDRVHLHEMHMLMIHCVLFGGGYISETLAVAQRYL